MYLYVRNKSDLAVLAVVNYQPCQYFSSAYRHMYSILVWQAIEPKYYIIDYFYDQCWWVLLERQ